jgi:hypothetical protein
MNASSPFSPRRRKLLLASASTVVAGTLGIFTAHRYTAGRGTWIEAVVRNNLPGVQIDAASLERFVHAVLASDLLDTRKVKLMVLADSAIPALARLVMPARERIERLERLVLSEFLSNSNFFRVNDPQREVIAYVGEIPACGNPFAVFLSS